MAALGRSSVYYNFFRSSVRVLFNGFKPTLRKRSRWTNVLTSGVASVAVGGGLCAVPFKQVDNLSYDSLIKRAASLATDSSNSFLSQTTLALIEAVTEYAKAVYTLVSLQQRYLEALGKLTRAEEDAVWQAIIGQRARVSDTKEECRRLESIWSTAVTLCETAAEAAYVSGAEHACVMAKTNIQVAQSQVEEVQRTSLDADKKLAETKVMEVERMAQHAASLQSSDNEEDVPEAYLRED
ncbi:diablo homolog, mitochondrial [Oryzias melastigma]|uniref:Direct IAP-binding protein with low pI n=1 Tax=Oryzias melastigma TaxID=30732 RepID=A0A3B3CZC6_ORYME|nr:diablo homolog, mitochondrial [Oryzias melastigma]